MSRVLIESFTPRASTIHQERHIARLSKRVARLAADISPHRLTDDPASADIILFDLSYAQFFRGLDLFRRQLRDHPYFLNFRTKCFVYDPDYDPYPVLPGAYVNLDRRWASRFNHRSAPYFHTHDNPYLEQHSESNLRPYLYSFVGATATHPLREKLMQLPNDRALLAETEDRWITDESERQDWKYRYAQSIHASKFVLCPRGRGAASMRIFEVMRASRVPVVISDAWLQIAGPDWSGFSITIPEREVARIPQILESIEPSADMMGVRAREVYDAWFRDDQVARLVVDLCVQIQAERRGASGFDAFRDATNVSRSAHLFRRGYVQRCVSALRSGVGR